MSIHGGNIEVIAADPKFDFLAPVALSDTEILSIRRPYRSPNAAPSATSVIFDALLAPFRLVYAVLQMLNFFTARYAGKPLLTSGNAKQKAADAQRMMVWGNLVDVQNDAGRAAQNSAGIDGTAGYELVRITKQGITTLARSAVAFDVAPDGTVYYSTGQKLLRLHNGKPEPVCDIDQVTELVVYG